MSTPTLKTGCARFVALVALAGAFNFLLERYPQHRGAIWTVWLVLGFVALTAAVIVYVPKLINGYKHRHSHDE